MSAFGVIISRLLPVLRVVTLFLSTAPPAMKQLYPFLLIAMTMAAGCATDDTCDDHETINCDLVDLSDEYIPVCGCDGITYQNAGHAQCVGHITQYVDGVCE
jgi:hypothetical protein